MGLFFRKARPGSEMACQNDQNGSFNFAFWCPAWAVRCVRVCRHDRVFIAPSWIALDSNSESNSVSRWRRMHLLLAKIVRCYGTR